MDLSPFSWLSKGLWFGGPSQEARPYYLTDRLLACVYEEDRESWNRSSRLSYLSDGYKQYLRDLSVQLKGIRERGGEAGPGVKDPAGIQFVNLSPAWRDPDVYSYFNNSVMEFPLNIWERPPGLGLCPLHILVTICSQMHQWLSLSPDNLVVLHARTCTGTERHLATFLAACHLIFSAGLDNVRLALDSLPPLGGRPRASKSLFDGNQEDGFRTAAALNALLPSQQRFGGYLAALLHAPHTLPPHSARPLLLKGILASRLGCLDPAGVAGASPRKAPAGRAPAPTHGPAPEGGARARALPDASRGSGRVLATLYQGGRAVWTQGASLDVLSGQDDTLSFDVGLVVQGDVTLALWFADHVGEWEPPAAAYSFHTAFVEAGVVRVTGLKLDLPGVGPGAAALAEAEGFFMDIMLDDDIVRMAEGEAGDLHTDVERLRGSWEALIDQTDGFLGFRPVPESGMDDVMSQIRAVQSARLRPSQIPRTLFREAGAVSAASSASSSPTAARLRRVGQSLLGPAASSSAASLAGSEEGGVAGGEAPPGRGAAIQVGVEKVAAGEVDMSEAGLEEPHAVEAELSLAKMEPAREAGGAGGASTSSPGHDLPDPRTVPGLRTNGPQDQQRAAEGTGAAHATTSAVPCDAQVTALDANATASAIEAHAATSVTTTPQKPSSGAPPPPPPPPLPPRPGGVPRSPSSGIAAQNPISGGAAQSPPPRDSTPPPPPPPPPPARRRSASSPSLTPAATAGPAEPAGGEETPTRVQRSESARVGGRPPPPPPPPPGKSASPLSRGPPGTPPPPPLPPKRGSPGGPGALGTPTPPALPRRKGSGVPPPPTPPSTPAVGAKKLRAFYWDTIRRKPGSVWEELGEAQPLEPVARNTLEQLFEVHPTVPARGRAGGAGSSGSGPKATGPVVKVLPLTRANNVSIMLTQFSTFPGFKSIRTALLTGSDALGLDHLSLLMQIVPSDDEAKALRAYPGPAEELSPPEKFMLVMSDVPRVIAKVGALMFRLQFRSLCEDAAAGMAAVRLATEQLRASRRLRRVLAAVLAAGNALNSGTARGGAAALKLESLLKLADVKVSGGSQPRPHAGRRGEGPGASRADGPGTEGAGVGPPSSDGPPAAPPFALKLRSLLDFVAWIVYRGEGAEVRAATQYLASELGALSEAVRRMQSDVQEALRALQGGLASARKEHATEVAEESAAEAGASPADFAAVLGAFLAQAEAQLAELSEASAATEQEARRTLEWLGAGVNQDAASVFELLHRHVTAFDAAYATVHRLATQKR